MRRLLFITFGVVVGLAAYVGTTTTEAQQSARVTCTPTAVAAHSGGVNGDCQVENFPPNTSITFTPGGGQATTDGAGRGSGTVIIPAGLCPGTFTITASGGGVEASAIVGVTPAPGPPGECPEPVPAEPRLTG
jgi:hypothetical protein